MEDKIIYRGSKRMADFQAHFFSALSTKIAEMKQDGLDVIRLDEGSPDLPPPKEVIEMLALSASQDSTHSYQSHRGTKELREAWTGMYQRLYGLNLDPETEVIPLLGSKEGIIHFPMTVVDPGDIVLVPDPGYITYTRGAIMAGGQPLNFNLPRENHYLPELEKLPVDVLKRVKLVWLNYPNNPTAAFASKDFFESIIRLAHRYQFVVCHDAAYSQVTFNGKPAPSILQVDGSKEVAVEFNTLSKSHNMAGWRVGAILGNHHLLSQFLTFKTNLDSGHFLPIIDAATTAMTGDQKWILERNNIYKIRKDTIVSALQEMDLEFTDTLGSLYVWCSVLPGWKSIDFTRLLLENAHVSLTPGTVFGNQGEGFMRISITAPKERIEDAMQRIKKVLLSVRQRKGG